VLYQRFACSVFKVHDVEHSFVTTPKVYHDNILMSTIFLKKFSTFKLLGSSSVI
jgi:hypothetical protein